MMSDVSQSVTGIALLYFGLYLRNIAFHRIFFSNSEYFYFDLFTFDVSQSVSLIYILPYILGNQLFTKNCKITEYMYVTYICSHLICSVCQSRL